MFNRLSLTSNCLTMHFRCKNCKQILFRQDYIDQYIRYNSQDLGQLQSYASYPKLEEDIQYFMLNSQTYLSSFCVDYKQVLLTNYHPFFKMYMYIVECQNCKTFLGNQIETVNQNTYWMSGRILIDISKISLIKEGKQSLPKLIKTLQTKLARKIKDRQNQLQQSEVQHRQNKPKNEKQYIQKLQRLAVKQQNRNNKGSVHSKNSIFRNQMSQKAVLDSLQTTNLHTNYVSRNQSSHPGFIMNSAFQSDNSRNDLYQQEKQERKYIRIEEALTQQSEQVKNAQTSPMNEGAKAQQIIPNPQPPCQQFLNLSSQQRCILQQNLHDMKRLILSQSKPLSCQSQIKRIFTQLQRIQEIERQIYKRIGYDMHNMSKMMTIIRKQVLPRFMELV